MIKRISDKLRKRKLEYKKLRADFLIDNPWCAWGLKQNPPQHIRATSIHHTRGRLGRLLNDTRFWLAVSNEGHEWIHNHINEARGLGLICQPGQWNCIPKS